MEYIVLAIFLTVVAYCVFEEVYKWRLKRRELEVRKLELLVADRDKRILELEEENKHIELGLQKDWEDNFYLELRKGERNG